MTMKFQHDFKSVPKKRVLLLQQKRPQRGLQGGNMFRRFQTLEIGKWKIPSCQLRKPSVASGHVNEELRWCLRSRAWTFWLEVRMPYLYIKQENETERLYTFRLIVTALAFRRVGFLHRLGTQPSCQGGTTCVLLGLTKCFKETQAHALFPSFFGLTYGVVSGVLSTVRQFQVLTSKNVYWRLKTRISRTGSRIVTKCICCLWNHLNQCEHANITSYQHSLRHETATKRACPESQASHVVSTLTKIIQNLSLEKPCGFPI